MLPSAHTDLARFRQRFTLINRNSTLLWLASTVSFIGDVLCMIVFTFWIGTLLYHQNYASLVIRGIALAFALATLVVSPCAGVCVDRWQKHKTMRSMVVLRAALVLPLLLVSGSGPLVFLSARTAAMPLPVKLDAMSLVVAAVRSMSQCFIPRTLALLRQLVPEEYLIRASALTRGIALAVWPLRAALAGRCSTALGVVGPLP